MCGKRGESLVVMGGEAEEGGKEDVCQKQVGSGGRQAMTLNLAPGLIHDRGESQHKLGSRAGGCLKGTRSSTPISQSGTWGRAGRVSGQATGNCV